MHRVTWAYALIFSSSIIASHSMADTIKMDLNVADIQTQPYHKPYVSVWLETKERKGVETLSIWNYQEKEDWLKDLRQWWRKIGRNNRDFDGVSSATRSSGSYPLVFNPTLKAGSYRLCIEATREDGGREFLYQPIEIGTGKAQDYTLNGQHELGAINIQIIPE